ncbi:hypothetical protein ZIOFF_014198 [Zingiber officinale]|uniref:Disease resistance N-terminal domain-containing protein n=1 Tax=Zingiber officinale TaxID=94328 RepID=A0A8J5HH19_ZINOF|nr:hypothetical protein ZIOFF_014198 [Zingiber officinale]
MLEEEAALLAGVEDDVRYIIDELRSITSFLTTMSTRRNLDDQLQNWVWEVREVAYDTEDLIDEFECHLRSTPYNERRVKEVMEVESIDETQRGDQGFGSTSVTQQTPPPYHQDIKAKMKVVVQEQVEVSRAKSLAASFIPSDASSSYSTPGGEDDPKTWYSTILEPEQLWDDIFQMLVPTPTPEKSWEESMKVLCPEEQQSRHNYLFTLQTEEEDDYLEYMQYLVEQDLQAYSSELSYPRQQFTNSFATKISSSQIVRSENLLFLRAFALLRWIVPRSVPHQSYLIVRYATSR